MGRQFVVGDIHGCFKGLMQCIDRSGFTKDDELIVLGDVCDGWPEVDKVIDYLISLGDNCVFIFGNHDNWALDWMLGKDPGRIWKDQGGMGTLTSYGQQFEQNPAAVPASHVQFLKNANYWFHDEETNRLFVHGGINPKERLEGQPLEIFLWDRSMINWAIQNQTIANKQKLKPKNLTMFSEVFIGHTTTTYLANRGHSIISNDYIPEDIMKPIHACEVWALDTGAGWEGKLTMMDVNTKEYVQSDVVTTLYPGIRGRW